MKLIVISSSKNIDDEHVLITRMFEEGLQTFHLRKRRWSTLETDRFLKKIPKHFHNRIVLHHHHILSTKYNLKGIHLSKEHLERKWKYFWLKLRLKIKFHELTKSHSVHSLKSAYAIENGRFDYVFLGNLFNNITAEFINEFNCTNVQSLLTSRKDISWIARGGCTPKIIPVCKDMGFSGIAFYSWVWNNENPVNRLKIILNEFVKNDIKIE